MICYLIIAAATLLTLYLLGALLTFTIPDDVFEYKGIMYKFDGKYWIKQDEELER